MRRALPEEEKRSRPERDPARWAALPGLCCQAAGGQAGWAEAAAAAWFLFYAAAHLFDDLEDQDNPQAWWSSLGQGAAINAASGLLFVASLSLTDLFRNEQTRPLAAQVCSDFYRSILVMGSGQHRDLVFGQGGTQEWFEIAAAKSGAFFALACRCGARLAGALPERVEAFGRYGCHLGILIQILDDLADFRNFQNADRKRGVEHFRRSLPASYALEVLSPPLRDRLSECLAAGEGDEAGAELADLLDRCGAELYLIAEIERQKAKARRALEQAAPAEPAGEALRAFLDQLDPFE